MDLKRMGELIKRKREASSRTLREVAGAVGISPAYLSILETANNPKTKRPSKPSAEVLIALSRELGIDLDRLLELGGHEEMIGRVAISSMEDVPGGFENIQPAYDVEPSSDRRYSQRDRMSAHLILQELSQRQQSEIVICRGMAGTPIDQIPRVLSDLIASNEYLGFSEQLGQYQSVLALDIGTLRVLGPADASAVLRAALDRAVRESALLVLRRFQLLTSNSDADRALLRQLAMPTNALIVALVELASEDDRSPMPIFNALNPRIVTMRPYSAASTLSVIERYYSWPGFVIESGALDTLFAFEPTIYVNGHRKTLPYLAIDLIHETVASLRADAQSGSDEFFFALALQARDALSTIDRLGIPEVSSEIPRLEEVTRSKEVAGYFRDTWNKRLATFGDANEDVRRALGNGLKIHRDPSGAVRITRQFITLQLFGSTRYEFRLTEAFRNELVTLNSRF